MVHDLRVLAQPLGGDVFHARDSAGREIDAIIQFPSGRWAGFEVKLGASAETVCAAAAGLLGFAANVDAEDPMLTVVTGTGPSYRRADGVNVVAIGQLAAYVGEHGSHPRVRRVDLVDVLGTCVVRRRSPVEG